MSTDALLRRFLLTNDQNIVSLFVDAYDVGVQTVLQLAAVLATNTTLKDLTLSLCVLAATDCYKCVQAIANALRTNNALKSLRLSNVDDKGARMLAKALTVNTALQELLLQENPIEDAGAKALARMLRKKQSAIDIDLNWTKIGYAGAAALERAMRRNTTAYLCMMESLHVYSHATLQSIQQASWRNVSIREHRDAHCGRIVTIYCVALLVRRTQAACALQQCIGRDLHQTFRMVLKHCAVQR